jgi:hypothetical protein
MSRTTRYDRFRDVVRAWGLEAWAAGQSFEAVVRKPEFVKALEALFESEKEAEDGKLAEA